MKLIKSSVTYFQDKAKTMSSEENIAIYKVQNLQGETNAINKYLSTRIKKE